MFGTNNECILVESLEPEPIENYNTFNHNGMRFFDFCEKLMFIQQGNDYSNKYYQNRYFVEGRKAMSKPMGTEFIELIKTVASNISGASYHLFSVHGKSLFNDLKNLSKHKKMSFQCKLIENCTEIIADTTTNIIDTATQSISINLTTPSNSTSSINSIKENSDDHPITEIINDHPVIIGVVTTVAVVGVIGAVVYHYINKPNSQQYPSTQKLIESSSTPATICKSRENACCLPNDAQDTRHSLFNSISHTMDTVPNNNLPSDSGIIPKKQQHTGGVTFANNAHETMNNEDDMYLHLYEEPNNHLYDVPNNHSYVVANERTHNFIRFPLNNNIHKIEVNKEKTDHDMYVDMTEGNKQLNNNIQEPKLNKVDSECNMYKNMITVDKQLELVFDANNNSVDIVGGDLAVSL